MPSYAQLDLIADACNPLFGVVCLLRFGLLAKRREWPAFKRMAFLFAAALVFAYGLKWADARFGLWASMSLDYSTHAAVAVGVAAVLCACWRRWRPVWFVWVTTYFALMLWQRYHTFGDLAVTGSILGGLMAIAIVASKPRRADRGPSTTSGSTQA